MTSNCPLEGGLEVIDNKGVFDDYINSYGRVSYAPLIKKYPKVIKSKRGKYGGTWCHLNLLIDAAMYLDTDLKAVVTDEFINNRLLDFRDDGGEQFKALNALIDTLPDRTPIKNPKGNRGTYIQVAKLVRERLEIIDTWGYNESDHNAAVQKNRTMLLKMMCGLIQMGSIDSYPSLKRHIRAFPVQ